MLQLISEIFELFGRDFLRGYDALHVPVQGIELGLRPLLLQLNLAYFFVHLVPLLQKHITLPMKLPVLIIKLKCPIPQIIIILPDFLDLLLVVLPHQSILLLDGWFQIHLLRTHSVELLFQLCILLNVLS